MITTKQRNKSQDMGSQDVITELLHRGIKKAGKRNTHNKAVFQPQIQQKEYGQFACTPFRTSHAASYSVLHHCFQGGNR